LDGTFPLYHEFNSDVVADGLDKILNFKESGEIKYSGSLEKLSEDIPSRAPVLCAGCPHRAMYYGINLAIEELGLKPEDVIFASDIGCYTLGINPPYNAADYLLSMGSSVGDGCGFSVSTDQKVASFIGDSTFFHSGISPLINAVHNKHNFVLTVLDNRITAMTGGQPNPGIPIDGMGDEAPEVSIRKVALACGCDYVRVINPFNLEQVVKTYVEAMQEGNADKLMNITDVKGACAWTKCGRNASKFEETYNSISDEDAKAYEKTAKTGLDTAMGLLKSLGGVQISLNNIEKPEEMAKNLFKVKATMKMKVSVFGVDQEQDQDISLVVYNGRYIGEAK
jgi:TPP-dependent indolepyruvate ferredoxin oxidoreductase alpha subunit